MNEAEFAAWRAKIERRDAAARGLLDEATGWGERVDMSDDDAVLTWARHYLPRILAWSAEGDHR